MPELLFGQRGFKHKTTEGGVSVTANYTLNYLQLPLNLAYKFDAGNGSKIFIFAGPYVGYGLSSSVKAVGMDLTELTGFKFGSENDGIKPFDFGINAGIGYQFEKIFFKLQCNPGFMNISNDKSESVKNFNVAVTAGYFFN